MIFSPVVMTAKRFFIDFLICATNSFMDNDVIQLFYVAGYCHCSCWSVVWLYASTAVTRRHSWEIHECVHSRAYYCWIIHTGGNVLYSEFVDYGFRRDFLRDNLVVVIPFLCTEQKKNHLDFFSLFYKPLKQHLGNPRISILLQHLS
jgi:hypothetical protein